MSIILFIPPLFSEVLWRCTQYSLRGQTCSQIKSQYVLQIFSDIICVLQISEFLGNREGTAWLINLYKECVEPRWLLRLKWTPTKKMEEADSPSERKDNALCQSKNTLRFLDPSWLFNSTCWAKVASKEWNNFSCWQSFKEGADILGFLLRKATLDNGLCYWSPCQSKKTLRLRQILIYSWASSCRQINNHKQTWPIWLGFLTICQSHLLRGFWGVITESHVIRLGDQRRVERNTVNHLFCLKFRTIIVFSRCCNLQIYTTCFILSDNVAFNAIQFFLWIALLVLLVKICWYGKFLWFLLSWFWRRTRTVQVHALCNVQCVKYILQIVKCIFPSCIFPNFRIYLSKLLNVFVKVVKCFFVFKWQNYPPSHCKNPCEVKWKYRDYSL